MKFKLKAKTKKAIRGSISVLLVIILLPMLTFSAVIVDSSRLNMAKSMISSAGDLTMNTALANYDTILKDVYGLFAMSQEKTEAELETDLKNYFAETISNYGVVSKAEAGDYVSQLMGNFNTLLADAEGYQTEQLTNFLVLENITLNADRVDNSALANASILRNQIVEYMKFRAPLNFGMSFIDALKSFEVADDQMDVVQVQVKAQEGTEDVATACKKLIDLIREYDTLVLAIDSGESAVKGVSKHPGTDTVPLVDYDTQVEKYLSTWDEDYTHINKLLMVFLAKARTTNDVYLSKLNYIGGEYFVKADGTGIVYNNSGISKNLSLGGSTEAAKNQVNEQLGVVDGKVTIASTYDGKNFINKDYINSDKTAFTNEDEAIKNFIEYEKFLLNQSSDIKYSDVQNVLESLYILGKYYDNYYGKITAEVNTAYQNWQNAKGVLSGINTTISNIGTDLGNLVTNINDTTYSFAGDELDTDFLDRAGYKSTATSLLANDLPDISGGYESYYNSNLKSGSTNKYRNLMNNVATKLKTAGNGSEKDVAEAVLKYLSGSGKTLSKQIEDDVSVINRGLTIRLRDFFATLDTCSGYADRFTQKIGEYNTAVGQKSAAEAEVTRCQGVYDGKVQERSNMQTAYRERLNKFKDFSKAYQYDAYYYGSYITTATNIINRETNAVSDQFGKICTNIGNLKSKLDAIHTQCGTVKTQIENYIKKLDAWEDENEAYVKANGSDSFSKQTAADIATARQNYDLNSLATLTGCVKQLYDRYSEFHTYLQGDTYFKYGGLRLHEIKNADNAKTAAKNNIDSISSPIVTVEQATTSLGQLYKGGTGKTFVPHTVESYDSGTQKDTGRLCFLQPTVIQIQFLKYLNSSYPVTKTTQVKDDEGNDVSQNAEANYEKTEEDLKSPDESIDQMDGEPEETTAAGADAGDKKEEKPKTDKYGYSYKNVSIKDADKTDRPSEKKLGASSGDKDPGNSAFALGEDEKASNSVDKQGGALDSILSGLGSAITAGIENAYILTYIFENFSYNTMVQDAVMEVKKADMSGNGLADIATAQGYLKEDLTEIRDAQKTLSGFTKNASNNYLNGAEIEYLLFGNTTPSKNVTYAKASIYAIRFAFNCIYAFTNAEIRNVTMSAGLAVQAATLGIVPYQVVQIVLQLAMAAAESAVDLNMMMCGLDVAVVKTKETWMLSVTSAVQAGKEMVIQTATDVADKAINKVVGGLQEVVDVSADKLKGAIENVKADVQESANQAARDVIDSAFGVVTTKIETVLNDMQYKELETKEAALSWVRTQLSTAKTEIESELRNRFNGSDIGKKVVDAIINEGYIDEVIQQVQTPIETAINNAPTPSEAVDQVLNQILNIKMQMTNKVTSIVEDLCDNVSTYTTDAVNQIQGKLDGYIAQAGEDLSEEASKAIRDGVTNATNDFVDNTLSKVDTTVDGGVQGGSKSLASMIKFGYKEYLMLFTYLKICIDGIGDSSNNKILLRTADLIQLNVSHASKDKGAAYTHNKNTSFRMTNACTYISVTATADLDMFFMDMDIFASMVEEEPLEGETGTTVETDSTGTTIKYKGLLGY